MKITFQKGNRAGESLDFSPPGVFIGREADNDIQLLVDGVSQYHAKIIYDIDKWVVHDLESSNGTKVNGARITAPTTLESGDMIYVASEALKIEFSQQEFIKPNQTSTPAKDDAVKIKGPEEAKKILSPEKDPEKPTPTRTGLGGIPKKTKEQIAQEEEIHKLVQEALKEKKKRLTIISIIFAVIANALVLWWLISKL